MTHTAHDITISDPQALLELLTESIDIAIIEQIAAAIGYEPVWTVDLWEEGGGDAGGESVTAATAAEAVEAAEGQAKEAVDRWASDGDWPHGGTAEIGWRVRLGEWRDAGSVSRVVGPDHARLISDVCGDAGCGIDPDEHEWTSEGEGGCDQNPGVWSRGGTVMVYSEHCRRCGLHRKEVRLGSQRNPGEHDTVEYEMPDSWCVECQSSDGCDCQ